MKCLILAAGEGSRLKRNGEVKPLIPVLGIPLIERVIHTALEAGVDDFYVVTGYKGERVRAFLEGLSSRLKIHITSIINRDWKKDNGVSVLKAQKYLSEPFLMLMADHLFDPSIARKLMEFPLADGSIALGVDKNISNSSVDMDDVTRVMTENGRIRNINKGMAEFSGFDTGVFVCTPGIFNAIEQSEEKNGDTTLSGAVRVLAASGRAMAVGVNDAWVDVDDPAALKRAERSLLAKLRDKTSDGPVSRYLNRPLSVRITRRLVNYQITPNQISLFSFLCSVTASGLFMLANYPALLWGGLLAQFASVVDGCDGEVARVKFQNSHYGGWFDAVLDRYADAFLLFGLMWHAYTVKTDNLILLTGFLAIIGSFMLSYTADKYDNLMKNRIKAFKGFRMGRDVRVFVIFLGAIFNQVWLTLAVIAIAMNVETIRRVIVCRDHE